jgi:hypothetical protein
MIGDGFAHAIILYNMIGAGISLMLMVTVFRWIRRNPEQATPGGRAWASALGMAMMGVLVGNATKLAEGLDQVTWGSLWITASVTTCMIGAWHVISSTRSTQEHKEDGWESRT